MLGEQRQCYGWTVGSWSSSIHYQEVAKESKNSLAKKYKKLKGKNINYFMSLPVPRIVQQQVLSIESYQNICSYYIMANDHG